ncbi:hypothetical protein HYI36_18550 [Bacillus sp. Gen3]|nr:hypothetical protein [Bacillus sp. Gen3]
MINHIIDGISIKLNQVFGDSYEIYSEDVQQGLNVPCFFIGFLNSSKVQKLGTQFFKENFFDIHYFPKGPDSNTEMLNISEQLETEMEYIIVNGDIVRGTQMNSEIVDGVLHFFVNYNMSMVKVEEPYEPMGELLISGENRGDKNGY